MAGNKEQPVESAQETQAEEGSATGLNPLQVVRSVLAASLGVQSSKNRERDFRQGRAGVFIAAGVIFTLLFVATVFTVVQLVLKNAGN
ncbi:MAG: DUF2970 domain-containing protein [Halioglobus sp.]|nr:DUF2970 domain-containing protein [Halioglobus sp.]